MKAIINGKSDEYYGLNSNNPQSYNYYMMQP